MDFEQQEVPSLELAIAPLAFLTIDQYVTLVEGTSSDRRFILGRTETRELAARMGYDAGGLAILLSALSYVQDAIQKQGGVEGFEPTKAGYIEQIVSQVDVADDASEFKSTLTTRLGSIIRYSPNFPYFVKGRRLSAGFMPTIVGFSTFVDLRASFAEGENDDEIGEIQGYVPVIQCRVRLKDSLGEDSKLLFQIADEAIDDLIKSLQRAKLKSQAVKAAATRISQVM